MKVLEVLQCKFTLGVISLRSDEPHKPRRQIVSLNDLYPTISELAGVEIPSTTVGESVLPLAKSLGAGIADVQEALAETLDRFLEGEIIVSTTVVEPSENAEKRKAENAARRKAERRKQSSEKERPAK